MGGKRLSSAMEIAEEQGLRFARYANPDQAEMEQEADAFLHRDRSQAISKVAARE
jgi:hypothetical protein